MEILELVIGAVIGFIIGIFVYRNNVDMFAPIAGKIDVKFDEMKNEIAELKRELKDRNSQGGDTGDPLKRKY